MFRSPTKYYFGTSETLNVCKILDLKTDNDCKDFISDGRLFHKVTDDGMNEVAKISVRLAIISLSSAFRKG